MLNPTKDRLDYGQMLEPPPGYDLEFAVGTTYSLDLDALVGASLAMGLSQETDSQMMSNPVYLLEALRKTGDKVALFCENGRIHTPGKPTPLYILLEKMVFQVNTAKQKGIAAYPSFHPKCWLLKYNNEWNRPLYRFMILSRNLTFDRSWDVTFCMDGEVASQVAVKNVPLCDFLEYLASCLPKTPDGRSKTRCIRMLVRELANVVFKPAEPEFIDYEFLPGGIRKPGGGNYSFKDTALFTGTYHELLVISPFLSKDIIRDFNFRNENRIAKYRNVLITRAASLQKLVPDDISQFEKIYTMRDAVIDGEADLSEGEADVRKQDIHAKVYMMRKDASTDLYLGSLNASRNAVYGNVEFMIRLRAKNRHLNLDSLLRSLFGGTEDNPDNPFEAVPKGELTGEEEAEPGAALDAVIKEIVRSNPSAEVFPEEDGYLVVVTFGSFGRRDVTVQVCPILLPGLVRDLEPQICFTGLQLTQLSEFYVVTVSDGEDSVSRVIKIPTKGIPEERENAVVTSIVSNRECFYRYVTFLLGSDAVLSMLESDAAERAGLLGPDRPGGGEQLPALYEKMLQTAASDPERFKGIDYLIRTISDDDIIPESFKELYDMFRKAVKLSD